MLFELLAVVCAGLFAGAAIYISAVEHPARLECGSALAVAEFAPSYRRATLMQAPLATVGFLAATAAWAQRLLDPALDRDSAEARMLLNRWGRLHAVRSAASGAGFLLLLWEVGSRH